MRTETKNTKLMYILPILFGFFVMGFVDLVGVSTSYVKEDFGLNDKLANLLPAMVFIWFAVLSLPTGILMGKIGRKKVVQISSLVTCVAMIIPLFSYSFPAVLAAFALLGIGNTILQVSLNPLLASVVDERRMTGMLTLGQFIKAISSFLGPILIGAAVGMFGNWKLVFPLYAALTVVSIIWLGATPVAETLEPRGDKTGDKILSLLKNKSLLVLFSVIVLIVGFEIGLVTTIPKYFLERCSLPIDKGGLGCSLYYAARMAGTFAGSFLLMKIPAGKFLRVTMLMAILALGVFMAFDTVWILMGALFVVGLACANVFAIVFGAALKTDTSKANEISALMIMGVAGGALIPPVMGAVADVTNQLTSLFVLVAILGYIFLTSVRIK